ncbi:MAG: DUF2088 domain-containing protein [candidate division Zixibacteria bacterium]|nr:DUF2088 domain-containing protein [candidate division Zixibacteria bacterium]
MDASDSPGFVDIFYAADRLRLLLPVTASLDTYAPRLTENPVSFESCRDILQELIVTPQFQSPRLLTVVNDGHRTTPTPIMLDWLSRIDQTYLDRTDFLIATGTHEPPSEEHCRNIFGPLYDDLRSRIHVHRAREMETMTDLGTDPMGERVLINKMVMDYPAILVLGSVEPHYFAGYTGGRKGFFPGLTDLATTERNHNLAASLDAAPLRLEGNPVAEHMKALTKLLPLEKVKTVQVVLDARHQVAGCFSGSLWDAFQQATTKAREIFAHRVSRQYDVVLAEILPPLDVNLYQAQKALENCQTVVKDGGSIILFSACEAGIGSAFFYDLAQKWDHERNVAADGKQYFGSHKLSRVNLMSRRIGVYLHSELKAEEVRRVFYEPLDNPQEFLYSTLEKCEKSNIAVVFDAAHTVLNA